MGRYEDSQDSLRQVKPILQSNFEINFRHLEEAVAGRLKDSCTPTANDKQLLEVSLSNTIHSIVDYSDRFLNRSNKIVSACRYANNALKHSVLYVSHQEMTGCDCKKDCAHRKHQIVWRYDERVVVPGKVQNLAFKELFAGKPILETLKPMAEIIRSGVEQGLYD